MYTWTDITLSTRLTLCYSIAYLTEVFENFHYTASKGKFLIKILILLLMITNPIYLTSSLSSWMMSFTSQRLLKLSSKSGYLSVLPKKFLDTHFFILVFAFSSSRVFQEQSSSSGLQLLQTCVWCQISEQNQEKEWGSIMNGHTTSFFIFMCVLVDISLCLDSEVSCDHFLEPDY